MIAPVPQWICAAALTLAAGSAWTQGITARTVVLGQSAPLSGPLRPVGEEIRNGALAYLRTLNDAGGVHGRRIELATLDDAGEPDRALANTRRFIEEFGVFALLAYPGQSATNEVLELASKVGMPLVGPVSRASSVRRPGRGVFAVSAGLVREVDQIVDYYAALGLRRMAIVRSEGADGAPWIAAARRACARRDLPAPSDIVVGAAGAGPAARKALEAGAEVLIVAQAQPAAADLVRAVKRGAAGTQVVVTSLASAPSLAGALGTDGAGVSLAQVVPPIDRISLPIVVAYRAAYAAETASQAYSPASFEAFIGAKVLAEAARRAGPALTREKFLLALEATSALDTGGHLVRFSRNSREGSGRIYLLAIGRDGALLH